MKKLSTCIFTLLALTGAANATTITYHTAPGATFASLPEDLAVTITTAANTITVSFDNKTVNPKADTQAISGLTFVLDQFNNATPTLPAAPQALGTLINIVSNSTAATIDSVDKISTWQVSGLAAGNATTVNMNVFSGGSPEDLIIGTAPGNIYSNANNSIKNHNPFIKEFATFTISMAGVTADTRITSASFNVGTTTPQQLTGVAATPEPGTFMLMSLTAVPFFFCLRKKRS